MDKLQNAVALSREAKGLLENGLLNQTLDHLERAYLDAWRDTSPDQVRQREQLWMAVNVVGKFKEHLGIVVQNGKLAQAEIDAMNKAAA